MACAAAVCAIPFCYNNATMSCRFLVIGSLAAMQVALTAADTSNAVSYLVRDVSQVSRGKILRIACLMAATVLPQ
jgi:hypothetical protein